MKYDNERGGYVLTPDEVENLNKKMDRARRLCEEMELLERLTLWNPTPTGKRLLN
jgi:hypothetical protein